MDITAKYDGRSFLAATLTEAILEFDIFVIVIECSIRIETLLDKCRVSFTTGSTSTDADREKGHE